MSYPWFGAEQSRWPVVPIRRVCRLGTGHTPDRGNPGYWREEECVIPWVTVADIHRLPGLGLTPIQETEQHISELGLANSAAVLHPPGTVMVSRTASIGFTCRIGQPMATTQAFVTWTPGPRVDSRYLLLVAKALAPEFDRLAYGSTHLTIYMPDIEGITMPLPPLAAQRVIANYLERETARIDSLIRVKNRMLGLLAERERAIRSRLVLGASNSAPYPRVRLKFLSPQVGVGVVVNPSQYFSKDGVPFLHGSHITGSGIRFDPPKYMSASDNAKLPASRLHTGDVIVVRAGYPGRAVVVPPEFDGANCASIIIIRKGKKIRPDFLAGFLNSAEGARQVALVQYGAAQEQINVSHIVDFLVPCPSVAEQATAVRRIEQLCAPLHQVRQHLSRQIGLLKEHRQALITAAVTGKLDIPEAA